MVPPINLEITAKYQFYRNFQGCWEDRTQSVGQLFIWEQTVIEVIVWFSYEKVH